jgi:hypothetical protein
MASYVWSCGTSEKASYASRRKYKEVEGRLLKEIAELERSLRKEIEQVRREIEQMRVAAKALYPSRMVFSESEVP